MRVRDSCQGSLGEARQQQRTALLYPTLSYPIYYLNISYPHPILPRLDDIVIFEPLDRSQLLGVGRLMAGELNGRLAPKNITLELTDGALGHVVASAYDPAYGARPLRRWLEHHIITDLSRMIGVWGLCVCVGWLRVCVCLCVHNVWVVCVCMCVGVSVCVCTCMCRGGGGNMFVCVCHCRAPHAARAHICPAPACYLTSQLLGSCQTALTWYVTTAWLPGRRRAVRALQLAAAARSLMAEDGARRRQRRCRRWWRASQWQAWCTGVCVCVLGGMARRARWGRGTGRLSLRTPTSTARACSPSPHMHTSLLCLFTRLKA